MNTLDNTCIIEGCEKKRNSANKYCAMHLARWYRNGTFDKKTRIEEILDQIIKMENGCWEFQGAKFKGYGRTSYNGKKTLIHRLVYEYLIEPIPEGKILCHKCDNPCCVNPEHLFVGTRTDNHKDMVNKKRHVYGEKHPRAILTEKEVNEIRNNSILTQTELSKKYHISLSAIGNICNNKKWKHLL